MKRPSVHRSLAAASIVLASLALSDIAPAAGKEWYESFSVEFRRRPTATLLYGWGATSLEDIRTPLTDPRVLDLQLGGSRTTREEESPELLRFKNSYLSLALYAPRLGSIDPVPGEASFDQFKLHIADVKGYGYELWAPDNELILYNGGTFGWTWMELVTPSPFADEQQFLQTFTDGVRFGTSSAAGVRVNPIPMIALDVRVDRDLVFRRHLVAAWGLSALIEGAAGWGVDEFVSSVMKSTPEAVPVVSFLLRGGLAYGFSELRRTNMNWPFTSEPALVNDAFKVGLSFMF